MTRSDSMEQTKQSFEQAFREKSYYEKQTRDDAHLQRILDCLTIHEGDTILDLGTGTGYVAIPLAWNNPTCQIIGLDIIDSTMKENQERATTLHLPNLSYQVYDGGSMPFQDNTFDIIVSRFAIHHFTDIKKTFHEIGRVLKDGGIFFLSDPTPNPDDTTGFVDTFMQLKNDGHIKFYTKKEFISIAKDAGFHLKESFLTSIRFPSKTRTKGYLKIADSLDPDMVESYNISLENDEVTITEHVLNMTFINL